MSRLSITAIVIAHNTQGIYACINSIMRQIDENDEIIIVDDHSNDEYLNRLTQYCMSNKIMLIQADTCGNRARNRNLGAIQASNDILLFIDADMVILQKTISAIKKAYMSQTHVAYIGTRSAGRYDPQRYKLLYNIDVEKTISALEDIDFLSDLPSVKDKRINEKIYMEGLPQQKYYWIYYYTCCCTVLKKVFDEIGGFYENFEGWGAEDIDLGYRISQVGTIAFLKDFQGVHIPHNRSVILSEQDNCNNLKILLKKYQTFDIEFISVYRLSANQLENIRDFLNHMRMISIPTMASKISIKKNTLYIDCISQECPYGKISFLDENNVCQEYTLVGISTFFHCEEFDNVVINSGVFLYPMSLLCGVIQEAIRIGKKVYIDDNLPNYRYKWNTFPELTAVQPQKRNEYRIYDLMEFDFEYNQETKLYSVSSDYLQMEPSKVVPLKLKPVKHNILIKQETPYCVINLTIGSGYKLLLKQLQALYHLTVLSVYTLHNNVDFIKAKYAFPEHMYSLLSMKTHLIIVVDKINKFNFEFREWEGRNHRGDILIDSYGNSLFF